MKRLASILLIALTAFSAASAAQKDQGLKVMSFNIRYATANDGTNSWDFRGPAVLAMLKDQAPDVIGLQEAMIPQTGFISYFLDGYKCVGVGREDGKKKGEQMSVYYNSKTVSLKKWGTFWLSETPDTPSKGWDGECYRCATWAVMKDKKTGKSFFFVNTHLDHKGDIAREEGIKTLLEQIDKRNKDGLPVVITGDFNMTPDNSNLKPLKARMKATREIAASTDSHATANGWGKSSKIIDYIWESGFSSCTEYETVTKPYEGRTYISDHYPIVSTLIF